MKRLRSSRFIKWKRDVVKGKLGIRVDVLAAVIEVGFAVVRQRVTKLTPITPRFVCACAGAGASDRGISLFTDHRRSASSRSAVMASVRTRARGVEVDPASHSSELGAAELIPARSSLADSPEEFSVDDDDRGWRMARKLLGEVGRGGG